jgi:hypothetical protein
MMGICSFSRLSSSSYNGMLFIVRDPRGEYNNVKDKREQEEDIYNEDRIRQ